MTKRSRPIAIDQTPPVGDITDVSKGHPPIAVIADIIWGFLGPSRFEEAWVMAWTKEQVLVYYRVDGEPEPIIVWLRADQVRRR